MNRRAPVTWPRWLSQPSFSGLKRFQFRWTSASIALLVTTGLATVLSQSRPKALGLAKLLLAADLLQSFPVDRSQPVPELWLKRLGPEAKTFWKQSSGSWWQLWSRHEDRGAYLVINGDHLPKGHHLPGTIVVDDLLVIAPDALAAQEMKEPLRVTQHQLQGLEQRCLERLQQGQAVYWSSQGLAGILGPLTPLMLHWQQGCLSLQLSSDRLSWEGEASAVPGLRGAKPQLLQPDPGQKNTTNLPSGTVLALRGSRLDVLIGSLLRRSLVRDSLSNHYGLDQESLQRLARSPFELSLRSLPAGPFRLGLTLEVGVGKDRKAWLKALEQLQAGLLNQGLQGGAGSVTQQGTLPQAQASDQTWKRSNGVIVGGWRWLPAKEPSQPGEDKSNRLLLFLGPPPPLGFGLRGAFPGSWTNGQVQVVMRPNQLAKEQMMPAGLPPLIHAAERLDFVAGSPITGERPGEFSPLWGELRLQPAPR